MKNLSNMPWWEILLRIPTHTLNVLTGGSIKHSFSARPRKACYELDKKWATIAVKVIDTLLWFHKDHCYKEYLNEFGE